jgi:hypothetical protein
MENPNYAVTIETLGKENAIGIRKIGKGKPINDIPTKLPTNIAGNFECPCCLRIIGRGNCLDDIAEFSCIPEQTIFKFFPLFIHNFVARYKDVYIYMPEGLYNKNTIYSHYYIYIVIFNHSVFVVEI